MVALQVTETVPFGPFGTPYTCQIHVRSVARTPFQTVSLGTLVNKLPVNAPDPSRWHHGCCRPVGEKRGLARRRNFYVGGTE
jgi:hypothetical protein